MKQLNLIRSLTVAAMIAGGGQMAVAQGGGTTDRTDTNMATGTTGATETTGTARGAKAKDKSKIKSASISFPEGQAQLSENSRQEIRDMVKKARKAGKIEEAKVAVWSDQALPREGDLPEAARDLANQRAENLENFLQDELNIGTVDTFNMADRANWLARTFNTEEAELQAAFAQRGDGAGVDDPQFRAIKAEGGPSKAVVILQHDKQLKKAK